ncbi:GNAT family N-acetyltransferase [Nonomuraea endophytica]|uniref:Ribosomal protein S18 acetylase RimI-like enzyme n=1 Tax=Nonomuraea endophytica TaxID=714136 RepID=A0A7W8ENJ9_9ACTN|nr:GNAT family N-acetyltransferase [Nonomuraea endophytica]MBB5085167.1 ribosomal protein S18 acetylase RimI-like enzyme [Nonomuraea endophytica]
MPIRYALPPDAEAMAEVTCAAFARFPDFDVTPAQSAANWRRNLEAEAAERPRPHHTRIAELPDGTVVGLVMGGPADPKLGCDAEIYALAVRPGHEGRGHGRALLRASAADLAAAGFGSLAIRVRAGNERARRFYESLGGVEAGEAPPDELVYSWPEIGAAGRQ